MPRRGYRKGISDAKKPRPALLRCRASAKTDAALRAEAAGRSMTLSSLVAEIIDAHANNRRAELPHAHGVSAALLRELTRIGNNLNQIAHQANMMRLHLIQAEAKACLAVLQVALGKL